MNDLNLWTIIAQIINFLLLMFLLKHFLWKKIADAIEERHAKLEKIALMEKEYNDKLALVNKEAQEILDETRKRSEEIENFAISSANKQKENILSKAEEEAKGMIEWATKEIEVEKNKMLSTIKTRVVDLALRVNQKLFDKSNINKDFVERELNSIN